ncbi:hypothetical protein MEO40_26600 [Dolichospermum sp. ST_sed1]|nr:hypothetical protein [Dolichospermum sp. ST_sed1]
MVIDFIYKLNSVLPNWPSSAHWTLNQISHATSTSVPHVLQYISEGLSKELDVTGVVSHDEAMQAIDLLSKKLRPQIEVREKYLAEKRKKAVEAYERMMEKTRVLMSSGNKHAAYKTLIYFAGQYEAELPREILVSACSDAVRIGIKAGINILELGRWLQKGVSVLMTKQSKESIEDALDLIDAYGEYFLQEESGIGAILLGNALASLEEPAALHELWEQYKALVANLYPM